MFIFKRKKKEAHDVDAEILELLDEHLGLIRLLNKDVKRLMLNDSDIAKIVGDQQKAISDLQKQIKDLQNLVNQNEGV